MKQSQKKLLLLLVLIKSCFIYAQIDTVTFISHQKEEIINEIKEKNINGLAISFFNKDKVIWSEAFGHLNIENKGLVNDKSIFAIHSMSKTFTATAVVFAVQDGLLDLDTPIVNYLPDFRINSCFENNPESKITLRHLLSHSAGFTHEAPIGNNYDASFQDFETHCNSIQDTWLRCCVGSEYHYSNLGYDLAAHIIEKVTGMSYSKYLEQKIFVPLQMEYTTANPDKLKTCSNKASGATFGLKSIPYKVPFVGAGGVYSNTEDLTKFVQFHLNFGWVNGKQLLKDKYLQEMYTPYIIKNSALGIFLNIEGNSFNLFHNGNGYGFGSSMKWYPEYGIGCVVLCNNQIEYVCDRIGTQILESYLNDSNLQKSQSLNSFKLNLSSRINKPDNIANSVIVNNSSTQTETNPDTLQWTDTYFKSEWKKYTGVYKIYMGGGFKFKWYSKIARIFGICPKVKIYEKDNYLYLSENSGGTKYKKGVQLFEYQSGLFFTRTGEALDFRNEEKTYRNLKLL